MNFERFQILSILRHFHRAQSGAALTEFAITLPVYLMFTAGIISLYNIQKDAILTHQLASSHLWEEAIEVQTSYTSRLFPLGGAANSFSYYSDVGETWTIMNGFDSVTSGLGMYNESGVKAGGMDLIPGFNVSPDPKVNLAPDVMDKESHSFCLMNDNALQSCDLSVSGFAAAINSLLDLAGARPGLAAGIRYGIVGVYDDTAYKSLEMLDNNDPKARYTVMAPTMPEERLMAVALTRLEMSRGHDAYDKFVAFGTGQTDFSGGGSIDVPDLEDLEQCGDDAQAAAQEYDDCCDVCFICRSNARKKLDKIGDECGGDAGGGQGMVDQMGDLGWGDIGSGPGNN